jgi:hypothetical protein
MLALLTGSILAVVYDQLLLAIFFLAITVFIGATTGKYNQKERFGKWQQLATELNFQFNIVDSPIRQWDDYKLTGKYNGYDVEIRTKLILSPRGPHTTDTTLSVMLRNPKINSFSLVPFTKWDGRDVEKLEPIENIYHITYVQPENFVKILSNETMCQLVELYRSGKVFQIWLLDGILHYKEGREFIDRVGVENVLRITTTLGQDLEEMN